MNNKVENTANANPSNNATQNQLQEIFFSENNQSFYCNQSKNHTIPASYKTFWICKQQRFEAFLQFISPLCTPKPPHFTHESLTEKLNEFLGVENVDLINVIDAKIIRSVA